MINAASARMTDSFSYQKQSVNNLQLLLQPTGRGLK